MVKIRAGDADRFLAVPDPKVRVLLVYGSDDGLVAERVATFTRAAIGDNDDLARVRLEADALADDPGLLADEANAVPLFGGTRVVHVPLAGNRSIVPAVESVLAAPPVDSWVVIAAGELRPSAPLRRLCESHSAAAAIPCYSDGDRDLDRLIDEETARAGLAIAADARAALKGLIGADRLVSRNEVEKLCLYAAGEGTITLDHVRAVSGDAAAFAVDETVDAAALGRGAALDRGYRRLTASGVPAFVVAGAALRHFDFLHKARAAFDDGAPARALVERARPPIFFPRQAAVARQISLWPLANVAHALSRLDRAMIDSRLHAALADEIIGEALHAIAVSAARAKRS